MSKRGIDVSTWQGTIDFKQVKASGIEFVIPREGYRRTIDGRFLEYVTKARAAGLEIPGVYHFLYCTNTTTDPVLEARSAIANVERAGLTHDVTIWADLEYDTVTSAARQGITLTNEMQRAMVIAFCEEVKRHGYKTGIYLNADYLVNKYGKDIANLYDIWLADWTGGPDHPCLIQQTGVSASGAVPGIAGQVDLDVWIGTHTAQQATKPDTPAQKTVTLMAEEVISGKWGTGQARKKAIDEYCKANGLSFGYNEVQAEVNRILSGGAVDDGASKPQQYQIALDVVKRGSRGEFVKAVQALLVWHGEDVGTAGVDGDFGGSTENAVKLFQAKHKLKADGVVNADTMKVLLNLT